MDQGIIERPVDTHGRADLDRHSPAIDRASTTVGSSDQICQFIAGDPTNSDDCKCGHPAKLGSSYCARHHAICWITKDEDWSDTLDLA